MKGMYNLIMPKIGSKMGGSIEILSKNHLLHNSNWWVGILEG